ncbi:thioredoxin [Megasphaera stantonii]|uniref:thioredoxin n=1 Tax=Megasphaera stantonii TaxID=2144175 RepID=UPI00294332F7|nr:thioredoxin [Megasphaera stantonii]
MAEVTITKDNFQAEVLSAQGIVLVDFWAAWCGPCRMLSPVVDEIAAETPHVKVGKINVDEQRELAGQFRIESIPTLIVFKDGLAVHRLVGVQPKEQILALLS